MSWSGRTGDLWMIWRDNLLLCPTSEWGDEYIEARSEKIPLTGSQEDRRPENTSRAIASGERVLYRNKAPIFTRLIGLWEVRDCTDLLCSIDRRLVQEVL